jgi:RHS repeat-associated protein
LTPYWPSPAAKDYFPSYDGNGNVMSVTRQDGTLVSIYEYSPFGELLRAEQRDTIDPVAQSNPFKFSTKYTDDETGLSYYGHRYYSAALGRFINRDPISEAGGVNLYGFCGNNAVSRWDLLGTLDPITVIGDPFAPNPDDPWSGSFNPNAPENVGRSFGGPSSSLDRFSWGLIPQIAPAWTSGTFKVPALLELPTAIGPRNGPSADVGRILRINPDGTIIVLESINLEALFARDSGRILGLRDAHERARDMLYALRSDDWPSNKEDHILIRKRTDKKGDHFVLSEVIPGDPNADRAKVPAASMRMIASDTSVVGLSHLHPDGRGRLSGEDFRTALFYGISISAVSFNGEAELFTPAVGRFDDVEDRVKFVREWQATYRASSLSELNEKGGKDLRFRHAPNLIDWYIPPGSYFPIDR